MTRAPRSAIALVLALAGSGAIAQEATDRFDGLWKATPSSDCARVGEDGGALQIEDNVFTGVESKCDMTRPVNVRDMDAVLYDMECRGEGLEWSDRAMMMRAADGGLIMVWDGFAFKYDACGADPAAGMVTTSDQIGITDILD